MTHIDTARQLFVDLQSKVMGEISAMLRTAKLTSIMDLADEAETFTESAEELEHFSKVTHTLAPMLGFEAKAAALEPYIDAVKRLGQAIDNGCSDSLGAVIAELDDLPYI
ncbi:hypothetical protein [Pseudidiomarina homiensis]|uniref:hypothetical protein n=1 Tax=Pseudidiomarina homiensis TaxID=364198 RepID=UPI00215AE2B1|nr:hypothetical protein [Pseudidiomarina homiensis]